MSAVWPRFDRRVPEASRGLSSLWPALLVLALFGAALVAAPSAFAPASGAHWVLLIILAPWAEELIFRLGLQEGMLRRWPTHGLAANVATALVFGLVHAWVRQDMAGLVVAAPALLMGQLYGRWRLVWPCVALHAAVNALWLLGLRDLLPHWMGA